MSGNRIENTDAQQEVIQNTYGQTIQRENNEQADHHEGKFMMNKQKQRSS
jgi:hypothetical protein